MQAPQFQAQRPQATQPQVMMAPSNGSKSNVFGSLAKLAYGAATGNPMAMFGGATGLLGGGGGQETGGQANVGTPGGSNKQQGLTHDVAEEPPTAQLPTIGDLSNAHLWGTPLAPMPMAPPSPFQGQAQPGNLSMAPQMWVNRMMMGGA